MLGILEGLLFVQGDIGLTIEKAMEILEIDEKTCKELIYELKLSYEDSDRGLRINYLGNTFKLTTKEEHQKYYQKLLSNSKEKGLSTQALEVLAIIAYNEPVTRQVIDDIRGVESNFVLRRLVARGLVKEDGRSTVPGRPILYKITDDFLDYFGLSSKDELPKLEIIEKSDSDDLDLYTSNYKEEE